MKMNSYLLVAGFNIMYQDEKRYFTRIDNGMVYPVPDSFYEAMDYRLGFKEPEENHENQS